MIVRSIARARRREFATRSLQAFSYALPSWFAVNTVVLLVHQGWSAAWPPVAPCLIVTGLLAVAAVVGYAAMGVSRQRIAGLLDVRADLKDRLRNALEFSARPQRGPLMELAIADAAEFAAGLNVRSLMPLWTSGNGRRLVTLLLLAPLLYIAAAVDLSALFAKKPAPVPGAPAAMPAELAGGGFRELPTGDVLQPAMTGLRGLIGTWRDRLAELRERAQAAAQAVEDELLPEAEIPVPGPSEAQERQGLALGELPAVRFDNRVHVSDLAALGGIDAELDENMRTAFNQLDQQVLDEDPHIEAVQEYVNQLRREADSGISSAQAIMAGASFASQLNANTDQMGAFRNRAQGAQQESFNEFMSQYAQHLGRIAERKTEVNEQRKLDEGENNNRRPLVADQGQQVPPNSEMRLVAVPPEIAQQMQLSPQMGQVMAPPPQTNDGPAGAGRGGGTYRGSIKVKHLEQDGQGRRESLQGQVDEGRGPDETFDDTEEDPIQNYNRLFQPFLEDAQQTLNDPTIPLSIRAYVQRYLQSISPEQVQGTH